MTYRPNVSQVRKYYWLTESGSRVDGIGLMRRGRLLVHLTPNEAIQLANNIIDTLEGQKP